MGLPAHAECVFAADVQLVIKHGHVAEGRSVAFDRLLRDLAQANTFDLRVGAGKEAIDKGGL